jgi:response regulator NasT
MIESALIVSRSEKGTAFFIEFLRVASVAQISAVTSCSEARQLMLDRDFDLAIVNAPLRDETGEDFSRQVASDGRAQVILVVKYEHYNQVAAVSSSAGVMTISKPIDNNLLWSTLNLADAAQAQVRRMQAENSVLQQKIEDIRIIDRAKILLIAQFSMSESEAHRFIEKQAMDMRTTRRAIAERIINSNGD